MVQDTKNTLIVVKRSLKLIYCPESAINLHLRRVIISLFLSFHLWYAELAVKIPILNSWMDITIYGRKNMGENCRFHIHLKILISDKRDLHRMKEYASGVQNIFCLKS